MQCGVLAPQTIIDLAQQNARGPYKNIISKAFVANGPATIDTVIYPTIEDANIMLRV